MEPRVARWSGRFALTTAGILELDWLRDEQRAGAALTLDQRRELAILEALEDARRRDPMLRILQELQRNRELVPADP